MGKIWKKGRGGLERWVTKWAHVPDSQKNRMYICTELLGGDELVYEATALAYGGKWHYMVREVRLLV